MSSRSASKGDCSKLPDAVRFVGRTAIGFTIIPLRVEHYLGAFE